MADIPSAFLQQMHGVLAIAQICAAGLVGVFFLVLAVEWVRRAFSRALERGRMDARPFRYRRSPRQGRNARPVAKAA